MGNTIRKINLCSSETIGEISRRHDITIVLTKSQPDEDLGHSFCYIRPDPDQNYISKINSNDKDQSFLQKTTTFSSISGASVSANTSTPLSTSVIDVVMYTSFNRSSTFQCSASFVSIPLQPVPLFSDRIERGFLSGPIERIFESGPIDKNSYSGNVEKVHDQFKLQRSCSDRESGVKQIFKKQGILNKVHRTITKKLSNSRKSSVDSSKKGDLSGKEMDWGNGLERNCENFTTLSSELSLNGDDQCFDSNGDDDDDDRTVQWAQGKAGEDRVHIVISDENGWVFVGIYDGFNGPDAPDFLLSNLYSSVHNELNGLLWNDKTSTDANDEVSDEPQFIKSCLDQQNHESTTGFTKSESKSDSNQNGETMRWGREKTEQSCSNTNNHDDVLKALSNALMKTEEAYLDVADKRLAENPELALMGSCVLAMLMKGEDVYLMNVGDSRAVLAQVPEAQSVDHGDDLGELPSLDSYQLTLDHSTSVKEEVRRIRKEHPDDDCAVMNDRVKGSLKVTRAFGAGFLKQPKWNNALLEMFQIDYIGNSPYINCKPHLHHHKLGLRDKFLILSSDGLYQYFTNQEAVSQVESFMCSSPEGDPAQHLIEEVLFRAAKKGGMDFHELLEIPQGDRRRFHDDVSIIIISLEGRIWRSSV